MQLTTQATIHVINWSPCRPSAPGSIFTPGCSAVASSGITIVLGYGGPHGPPCGTWRPIRMENPDCVLVEIGHLYKDAIRIESSVGLTKKKFKLNLLRMAQKSLLSFSLISLKYTLFQKTYTQTLSKNTKIIKRINMLIPGIEPIPFQIQCPCLRPLRYPCTTYF